MKAIVAALVVLVLVLQYQLWFATGGVFDAWHLKKELHKQQQENQRLIARNQALAAEVKDLKSGQQAAEERARSELGMIKHGEKYYQVVQ